MQIFESILLELLIFTVHFSFSSELGTHYFHAIYSSYSQQNVSMRTAPKMKVKVKNCPCSSEWPNCLCIVGMETSTGVHVPTQPKHSEGITVQGPHIGSRLAGCGPGPPTEGHGSSVCVCVYSGTPWNLKPLYTISLTFYLTLPLLSWETLCLIEDKIGYWQRSLREPV